MTRSPRSVAIRNNVVSSAPRSALGVDVGGSDGQGGFTSSLTVFFYDSTPGSTTWSWTFYAVNGSVLITSTVQNPVVTYPATGTYRATLETDNSTELADQMVTVV